MLIVEDDPLRARALERQAKAHSVVLVVPSGEAAIDVVERAPGRVWLALVDFGLPGIDGAETARRLRALDHEMVVVVATAQPDVHAISRAAFPSVSMFVPRARWS